MKVSCSCRDAKGCREVAATTVLIAAAMKEPTVAAYMEEPPSCRWCGRRVLPLKSGGAVRGGATGGCAGGTAETPSLLVK